MSRNIIQILKSGNQELFYSSFIAWLMDQEGEHGLGDQFAVWFFRKIGKNPQKFIIETEKRVKGGRADILLTTENRLRIVIENKTKSIGSHEQIVAYEDENTLVVLLGFVLENFPVQQRNRVVSYAEILSFLRSVKVSEASLSVLVTHFISYLELALGPFDVFHRFCCGELRIDQARAILPDISSITVSDNDRRFFQAIYFERLLASIMANNASLILGEQEYYDSKKGSDKPAATRWIIQKNVQGSAFMEAIIYSPEVPNHLKLSDRWSEVYAAAKNKEMSPRIELRVGPDDIFSPGPKGVLLLGCWDNELRYAFNSSGVFKNKGSRNFHNRILEIDDLNYQSMAKIIAEEMSKVWNILPNQAL